MRRRGLLRTVGAAGIAGLGVAGTPPLAGRADATDDGYEPLGSVPVDGACEAVVGDDGETVYLATIDGFATVDVAEPTDPALLADERNLLEADDLEFTEILDVKVSGDRLAVVGPGNPNPLSFDGFVIYDVSDPADPEQIGEPTETDYHIHNCYLEDDLLYLVGNDFERNPVTIFDVSGDEFEEIGRWSLLEFEPGWEDVDPMLWYLHDVYVQDGIAYLAYWNAGTYLLDVSDPAEPTYLSHVADTTLEENREIEDGMEGDYQLGLPGNDHYSAVDETGEIMAVNREAWVTDAPEANRPGGIDLYDVSDPASPTLEGHIEAPEAPDGTYNGGQWTTSHNFEIYDGWLYSSWYQGGVKIYDLEDLGDPEEITAWRDPDVAGFWTARVAHSGDNFVASSTPLIPNATTEGALYVFPSEPGEQVDPPAFDDNEADDRSDDSDDTDGSNETDDGADDVGGGTDATNATDVDGGDDTGGDTADAIPGFRAASAGVAGGVAFEAWRRRTESDREP